MFGVPPDGGDSAREFRRPNLGPEIVGDRDEDRRAYPLLLIGGTRVFLQTTFLDEYEKHDLLGAMVSMETQAEAVVLEEAVPHPVPLKEGQSRLARILEAKVIPLGTAAEDLPFADGTFSAVVCTEVIEHVADPDAALPPPHADPPSAPP